jgi:hypothetical protein
MKNFRYEMAIVFCTIILSCSKSTNVSSSTGGNTASHTYYVATNGNDANAGTIDAPLRTINNALSHTVPGDTVMVRGGTYSEKVLVSRPGISGKYITLEAFAGETPVIDGTTLSVNGTEGLITVNGVKFIVVRGFTTCNFKAIVSSGDPKGILVQGGSDYIEIRNNTVYNINYEHTPLDGGCNAILIKGNTSDPVTNIIVDGNIIHDCKTGYAENLTVNGYVDGFTVSNNTIYNAQNIGIDAAGGYGANSIPAYNYARNGVISGNTLYNIESSRGPLGGHGAIGIYVDGARHITVERNRVYSADRGIGAVSETVNFPTDSAIIRNNFIYNCWCSGIYMGGYLNYTTGGTTNCSIVNNTLYNNDRVTGAFGEIEGEISIREQCKGNVIGNNIIYAGPNDLLVHKYTSTGSNNTIDYNLYYTAGPYQWIWGSTNGTPITDFIAWKTNSGGDANSTSGTDPLLMDIVAPDLHIQTGSPARNTGLVISAGINGTTDIDGNPRIVNSKINKGAQQ